MSKPTHFNIAQKIKEVAIIEVSKIEGGLNLRLFLSSSTLEKELLKELALKTLEELKGFVNGCSEIFWPEFFVTEIGPGVLELTSWPQIRRLTIDVCHIDNVAITSQNLPLDIFERKKIEKKPFS